MHELSDIDANPTAYLQLGWALKSGDAIAFHMHASSGSASWRRVISERYLGDDARHVVRS